MNKLEEIGPISKIGPISSSGSSSQASIRRRLEIP